jgi:hypothetical protein
MTTKLERLLRRLHEANHRNHPYENVSTDTFIRFGFDVGIHVLSLWLDGRLDPNITVKPKKGERT